MWSHFLPHIHLAGSREPQSRLMVERNFRKHILIRSMKMSSRIRIGLIGVGNWAAYGHIPALRSLKSYEISAVASRRLDKATELAREFNIPHAFAEAEELIQHPDVDLVAVLPPAPEHARLSRQAIAAGKSLYCEWPLTTSTADSTELLSLATASGI